MLYRLADGWTLLDFKTNGLRNPAERDMAIAEYHPQLQRYTQAVLMLLGRPPARVCLCFLDDQGRVTIDG